MKYEQFLADVGKTRDEVKGMGRTLSRVKSVLSAAHDLVGKNERLEKENAELRDELDDWKGNAEGFQPDAYMKLPLHADGRAGIRRDESGNPASAVALERGTMAAQMREASKRGIEAMKKRRGYPGRPVEVDGRRYESQAEAATAEGFPRQALASLRSRSGAKAGDAVPYRGHEVRWLA